MAPFNRVFKHATRLAVTVPSVFLHSSVSLGIMDLFQRNITSHVCRLVSGLSLPTSTIGRILLHRLAAIQQAVHSPISPLLITNFSAFSRTLTFRIDFIFRLLVFSRSLGLTFIQPSSASSSSVDASHHTLLFELFHDAPALYARSLKFFKKHNISYLHSSFFSFLQ